jgi:adenylate cyclase
LTESKIELEKAIALDRNNSTAMLQLGITLLFLGQPEVAIPNIEHALQLNPHAQNVFFPYFWLGYSHLLLNQTDEAVDFLMKSQVANPRFGIQRMILAAALGSRGDLDEAKATLAEALKLKPEWNSLARLSAAFSNSNASPQYAALRSARKPSKSVCAVPGCPTNDAAAIVKAIAGASRSRQGGGLRGIVAGPKGWRRSGSG